MAEGVRGGAERRRQPSSCDRAENNILRARVVGRFLNFLSSQNTQVGMYSLRRKSGEECISGLQMGQGKWEEVRSAAA